MVSDTQALWRTQSLLDLVCKDLDCTRPGDWETVFCIVCQAEYGSRRDCMWQDRDRLHTVVNIFDVAMLHCIMHSVAKKQQKYMRTNMTHTRIYCTQSHICETWRNATDSGSKFNSSRWLYHSWLLPLITNELTNVH